MIHRNNLKTWNNEIEKGSNFVGVFLLGLLTCLVLEDISHMCLNIDKRHPLIDDFNKYDKDKR